MKNLTKLGVASALISVSLLFVLVEITMNSNQVVKLKKRLWLY